MFMRSWPPKPGGCLLRRGRGVIVSPLDSLYQQIVLEESKARRGGDLASDLLNGANLPENEGRCYQLNPVRGDEITLRFETSGDEVAGIHWAGMVALFRSLRPPSSATWWWA